MQFQAISATKPKTTDRTHFAFVLFGLFLWIFSRVLRLNVLVQVARLLETLATDIAHNLRTFNIPEMD